MLKIHFNSFTLSNVFKFLLIKKKKNLGSKYSQYDFLLIYNYIFVPIFKKIKIKSKALRYIGLPQPKKQVVFKGKLTPDQTQCFTLWISGGMCLGIYFRAMEYAKQYIESYTWIERQTINHRQVFKGWIMAKILLFCVGKRKPMLFRIQDAFGFYDTRVELREKKRSAPTPSSQGYPILSNHFKFID